MANVGKKFEKDWQDSVPIGIYIKRMPDPAIGFDVKNSTQRFAGKCPYDFVMYKQPFMYALEMKSTGTTSISFKGSSPMIKEHQIKELRKAHANGVKAGFVFNFRKSENTYYVPIEVFDAITCMQMIGKSSINEKDLLESDYMGDIIEIPSRLKKVSYHYDVEVLFKEAM